jgi:hypothetical protein
MKDSKNTQTSLKDEKSLSTRDSKKYSLVKKFGSKVVKQKPIQTTPVLIKTASDKIILEVVETNIDQNYKKFENQTAIEPLKTNISNQLPVKKNWLKTIFYSIFKTDYFLVFLLGLVFNLFIFRDVILNWGQILTGDVIVGPDELVPIFNFQTQYLDQQTNPFSELTGNFEFRVRYSWLTTWWRLNQILPFTLVFFNALSLTIIYWSVKKFTNLFFETKKIDSNFLFSGAFSGAFISYLILMYTKITHFYTLTFGFAIWSVGIVLSILLFLNFENLKRHQIFKRGAFIVLITVFNPATHYVVLTIFLIALLLTSDVLSKTWTTIKIKKIPDLRRPITLTIIASLIALGYLLYYFAFVTTFGKFGVQDFVGLTRRIIEASSSSIWQIISLQTGGILDFHHHALYQIEPGNRLFNLIYSLAVIGVFLITVFWVKQKTITPHTKFLGFFNSFLAILAVFFAIGYQNQFSAHNFASWVLGYTGDSTNIISRFLTSAITTFFLVLRFPHRFLFIYQLTVSFAISICLVWLLQNLISHWFNFKKQILSTLIIILALIPYFAGQQIAPTFFSGNWSGFFAPYQIPQDLKDIKQYLAQSKIQNKGKLLLLPSSEIPLRTTENNQQEIKTIDKLWIYYLNYPSLYYGLGSENSYKDNFFLVYFNLINNRSWLNLVRNKGVEYFLVNKNLGIRDGYNYRNDIEKKIQGDFDQLEKQGLVKKEIDGQNWTLYKLDDNLVSEKTNLFLNDDWSKTSREIFSRDVIFPDYTFYNINRDICEQNQFAIYGGNKVNFNSRQEPNYINQKNTKDLNLMCFKREIQYNDNLLPFKRDLSSTNDFISNSFTILTTGDSPQLTTYNNLDSVNPGTYGSIDKKMIFLTEKSSKLQFLFNLKEGGVKNIDLRAKALDNRLKITLKNNDGKTLLENNIQARDTNNFINTRGDYVLNNFNYYTLINKYDFQKGDYILEIEKLDDNTIAFDALTYYSDDQLQAVRDSYEIQNLEQNLWLYTKK